MKLFDCVVTSHTEVAPEHFRLVLKNKELAEVSQPGQFVMIEVTETWDPFLRRPMSIERMFSDSISILYKVVGKGTKLLSSIRVGEKISVQGPLGNSFPIDLDFKDFFIVGGGIGIAPFPGLAEKIIRIRGGNLHVIIGAKTHSQVLCERDFREMGCRVYVVTEDGSAGEKGLVTDVLDKLKVEVHSVVYACGPIQMIKKVHQICEERNWICYASLEAEMACGIGVCLGCVVPVKYEIENEMMARVCKEGPIFDTRVIQWEKI
ncbi:MAG: dihydroorotate dehydrogenase electron transfer subunit [Candidatus Hydrogenedentes bacterium]|nr:dihydroorotate dehydrogenase electron transfer subunit [Candidatus Hydrogenedentota bacterium]